MGYNDDAVYQDLEIALDIGQSQPHLLLTHDWALGSANGQKCHLLGAVGNCSNHQHQGSWLVDNRSRAAAGKVNFHGPQVSESLPPIIIHLTLQPGPIIMVRGLKSKLCPAVVAWWLVAGIIQ